MGAVSRFLIQILPAATVAPLFFQGKIEFGVINQSSSAFNHILTDVSLVVYQVQAAPLGYPDRLCASPATSQSGLSCLMHSQVARL